MCRLNSELTGLLGLKNISESESQEVTGMLTQYAALTLNKVTE